MVTGKAMMSSASVEWYTPDVIVDRAVAFLGGINLDPCADPEKRIPANAHYTAADDGLSREWWGSVFLNPPYGNGESACSAVTLSNCKKKRCAIRGYHIEEDGPGIIDWIAKLQHEFREQRVTRALVLMPARPDTRAWQMMRHDPVCFITGRLKFSGHKNSAPFPSALFAVGTGPALLYEHFGDIGDVYERY